MRFDIEPGIGALPIRFGMRQDEVRAFLGAPRFSRERYGGAGTGDSWPWMNVGYEPGGGVNHIGFSPHGAYELAIAGAVLWTPQEQPDPNAVLLRLDPAPLEVRGFLVFNRIGVTTTGYHDHDEAQRAVTVYPPGAWDASLRDATTPHLFGYSR